MNVTTITIVSVDEWSQGLGGPDEDRSGGFERGGCGCGLQRRNQGGSQPGGNLLAEYIEIGQRRSQ